jgi:hypothetical protein
MPRTKTPEHVERVKIDALRTLGTEKRKRAPAAVPASKAMQKRAQETLRAEFERVMTLQRKLAAETKIGGTEKGRTSPRHEDKLRSLIASLEGMNRFALQMGLVTPAESRELYAEAIRNGFYAGWR